MRADVAILLDHSSVWAQDHPAQPTGELRPVELIKRWHAELWRQGVTCDVVHPESDLSGYRLVLAPALYLVSDDGAAALERFVAGGGTALVGPYSGIVDENDRVRLGGYPGAWRDLLGVTVEEFFPLEPGESVKLTGGGSGSIWSEVAHAVTAKVLDTYETGEPAWTRNAWGQGAAHYLTTVLSGDDLAAVLRAVCAEAGVATRAVPGVELVRRAHPDGRAYLFAINHAAAPATVEATGTDLITGADVPGELTVPAGEVRIVRLT